MARENTKEILEYYAKGFSISRTASTLGLARKTVSTTFKETKKAWDMIEDIWFPGSSLCSLDKENENTALRLHLFSVYYSNPMPGKSPDEIKDYFLKCMDSMSNDEINNLLFQLDDEKKSIKDEEMMQVASFLEKPGSTLQDSYKWAKDKGLNIASFSEPYFKKLFREYRANNELSDRLKFKPGDVMEIRWYRLEQYKGDEEENAYPLSGQKYDEILKDAVKRKDKAKVNEIKTRKGRWLFIMYLPFSRRVSMRVFYKRDLDNMVTALMDEMNEVGIPKRLVSTSYKNSLVDSTRRWPLFTILLETYGVVYIKDDNLSVFEEMEKDLLFKIRECLKKTGWYKNINNNILSLMLTHKSRRSEIEKEKGYLRKIDLDKDGKKQKEIEELKVLPDSHILYGGKRYSCPYTYVGKVVSLSRSINRIFIYDEETKVLISEHEIIPREDKRKYSTHKEHMPESDEERIRVGMRTRLSLLGGVESEDIVWMFNRFLDALSSEEKGYETIRSMLFVFHKSNRKPLEDFSKNERSLWEALDKEGVDLKKRQEKLCDDLFEFKRTKATGKNVDISQNIYYALNSKNDDFANEDVEAPLSQTDFNVLGTEDVEEIDLPDS